MAKPPPRGSIISEPQEIEAPFWLCSLIGHNFGPWHNCAKSVADMRIDHQLRGCLRCETIQYFSPSGNI